MARAPTTTRQVKWGPARKRRWETETVVRLPIDFLFSHYPYLQKLRIQADWSGLKQGAKLKGLTFALRKKGQTRPVKVLAMPTDAGTRNEVTYAVPALNGEYELAMTAAGSGAPADALVKTFQRKVFPWEHNTLGKSRKVYPPFEADPRQGAPSGTPCWREHAVGRLGPVGSGHEHRQGVARRSHAPGGRRRPGRRLGIAFHADRPGRGQGVGGPVAGRADRALWTRPGTMTARCAWTSGWRPRAARRVDKLMLDIPLKDEAASHCHAMGDGIRNTLYERVPAGGGAVWTSAKVSVTRPARQLLRLHLCRHAQTRRVLVRRERPRLELGPEQAERRIGPGRLRAHAARAPRQQARGDRRPAPDHLWRAGRPGQAASAGLAPQVGHRPLHAAGARTSTGWPWATAERCIRPRRTCTCGT